MIPLLAYGENFYSQAGEDGIIAELCRRIVLGPFRIAVDIGAHDGSTNSNTAALIRDGWECFSFEASAVKFAALKERVGDKYCEYRIVTVNNINTLTQYEPDLLSMDIGGPDIHVWRALTAWRATIVIMEIHANFPLGRLHESRPDGPEIGHDRADNPTDWPASFSSMLALGIEKGYRLAVSTGLNMIFVDAQYAEQAGCPDDPNSLYLNGRRNKDYRAMVRDKTALRKAMAALAEEPK